MAIPQANVTTATNASIVVDTNRISNKMMILTFVNGIYHSETEVKDIATYLRCTFRSEVRTFYNPSSGSWVKDAYKAGFELVLRPNDLILAKQLAEHLRSALREVHPQRGRVLHIAHSGGAIITYLAAKYHLKFSESSRIDVVTLGAGRSLTHKYFRGRLYNYYARNDPVLLVESRAAQLLKKTKNDTYCIVRDAKHNTSFVFLKAVANEPIYDHAVDGPTYRIALDHEAREFQARLKLMVQSSARERDVLRLARKKVASLTGVHHFWKRYSWGHVATLTRRVRKLAANVTNVHGLLSGKSRGVARSRSFVSESAIFNLFGSSSNASDVGIIGKNTNDTTNSNRNNSALELHKLNKSRDVVSKHASQEVERSALLVQLEFVESS